MRRAILLLALAGRLATAQSLQALYDAHDWFGLRDAVARAEAPLLYRGVVAYAFHDLAQAEQHFRLTIKTAAGSEQANDARTFLISIAQFRGDYRQALSHVRALQAVAGSARGLDNAAALFGSLSRFPKQQVSRRRMVRVPYSIAGGNLFIPVSINGKAAEYIVDTGANFSVISESEAKRAGMSVRDAQGLNSNDAAGKAAPMRIAVARKLSVGGFEIRNVAFLVARDEQQPFADLPVARRGVLGIPVALSLETIRWSNGQFEAGFEPRRSPISDANMCFDGANPLVRADYHGVPIYVFLDTGATHTRLMPAFAKDFPDALAAASTGNATIRGVAGEAQAPAATLPALAFRMGASEAIISPAEVLLKDPNGKDDRFHIWAGMDLLSARKVTIDFGSMTFSLD